MSFGARIKALREAYRATDRSYSVRQLAERIGVDATYLSRLEREDVPPPGEEIIVKLARELGEDPDVLLGMAGKVSAEVRAVITRRPRQFAALIRQLKDAPDHIIEQTVRQVRDGKW